MNVKRIKINGKTSVDGLNVEKENRLLIRAIEKELNYEEELNIVITIEKGGDGQYQKEGKRAIEIKRNGYKTQDLKKNIYQQTTMITIEELNKKLIDCSLMCYYCSKHVKVLYRNVRDPLQWTLDRIDNSKNHSNNNTLISCLSCNLKRRNINKNDFFFSKNMILIKNND
jgi:hypothetical protein